MSVTIYHNPKCSTSRNTLALVRHLGEEPTVIEYLHEVPDPSTLKDLVARAGLQVRDVLRRKEAAYSELGLDDPSLSDDQLLAAVQQHPVLLERPVLVTERGVRWCRPIETALEILPPLTEPFFKENGDRIVGDVKGN